MIRSTNFHTATLLSAVVLFLNSVYFKAATAQTSKPNVIVLLGDDVGYADVGFHKVTADDARTPNLDRLAKSGVVFTNGYAASPVCSNSRLALSMGRYPQRWGGYYYGEGGFPTSEYSIAEMMREAGYRTMKVGKTHLNNGPKSDPMKHGFDHWLGFKQHSWDYFLLSQKDADAYDRKSPGSMQRGQTIGIGPLTRDSQTKESFENTNTTEVFGREALSFINRQSDQPFYLQVEFNAVHTLLHRAPEQLAKKYGIPARAFDREAAVWDYPHWDPIAQPNYKQWYDQTCHLTVPDAYGRKIYLAHMELMDAVIGQILDAVQKRGLTNETLIYFSSDNGGSHESYANNGPLHGYKYCLMEGGIRVPTVLSWPGTIKSGQTIGATVSQIDVYPSLAEIVGATPPNPLDGKSMLPVIRGQSSIVHEEPLFWDSGKRDNWVVRHGDWKLVYRGTERIYKSYQLDNAGLVKPEFQSKPIPTGLQLYNLKSDLGERSDLSETHPDLVQQLKRMYTQWRGEMKDPVRGRDGKKKK